MVTKHFCRFGKKSGEISPSKVNTEKTVPLELYKKHQINVAKKTCNHQIICKNGGNTEWAIGKTEKKTNNNNQQQHENDKNISGTVKIGRTTGRKFVFSQVHFKIQTKDVLRRRKIREVHIVPKKNVMTNDSHGHVKERGVSPENDVASQTWSIRCGARSGGDTA